MSIHVGTSGWSYRHWEGVLYPPGLEPRERLGFYARAFGTVEVNSTFYRWPRAATFARWRDASPGGFVWTAKAPRAMTHAARLYAPERWLGEVCRGAERLRPKLGVLLVQLPPGLALDLARLGYFLSILPRHLRVAVEFRHESWHREEVFRLLERWGAAYCVTSGARLPCVLRATAPFVYVRLHGPDHEHLYAGSYPDEDLRWWAARVREWAAQGRDVYAYFNNDGGGNAVRNAAALKRMLGV
ncbi:MAG TPA: DUF72 domain-containing protein [Pyrinomonadaceae bacterium]|nr:DUF72 domain-containing protein [Pyrinomonadaceae bacterium]